MNEEEVNQEIYSNLKYKIAPDEQDKAFDARLHSLRKEYFSKDLRQERKVVPFKIYLKWATGVAAILIVGLFIWAPWNADLYEQYVISRSISVAERGDAGADLLARAAEQYNSENYTAAKALFAEAYAAKPDDSMVAYYYAITLVETGELETGRTMFEALYEGESVFKYDAAYFMALSYVKQDQKKEALIWLDRIPAENTHHEAATELKSKLK